MSLWKLKQVSVGIVFGVNATDEIDDTTRGLSLLFGGDVRFDAPVHKFLMLGGRVLFRGGNFAGVPTRAMERLQVGWLDVGGVVRFRVPIAIAEGAALLAPYIAVMPALSVGTNPPWVMDKLGVGWALGMALGFRMIFPSRVGFFIEGGWEIARIKFDDARTTLRSGTIELGPLFAF